MPRNSPVLNRRVTVNAGTVELETRVTPFAWGTYEGLVLISQVLANHEWGTTPNNLLTFGNNAARLIPATQFLTGEYNAPPGDLGNKFRVFGPTADRYVEWDVSSVSRLSRRNFIVTNVSNGMLHGDDFPLVDRVLRAGWSGIATRVIGAAEQRQAWARVSEFEAVAGAIDLDTSEQRTVEERADFTIRYQSDLATVIGITDDRGRLWEAFSTRAILDRRYLAVSCKRTVQIG